MTDYKETPETKTESAPSKAEGRPDTSRGMAAMQGQETPPGFNAVLGLSGESKPLNPATVQEAVPRESVNAPHQLNAAEMNDLELASQSADASKATFWHGESEKGTENEYYRVRTEIGEKLAKDNLPNSVRADQFSEGGTNFPNYDVLSPDEASSVKVRAMRDGKISLRYREEFANLVCSNSELNQKAANRLMKIKESDPAEWEKLAPHLPSDVRNAESTNDAQTALADVATMRIPADQVAPVRTDLEKIIVQNPEKFGLDAKGGADDLATTAHQLVTDRILSIDERYDTAHYQAKAAEIVSGRGVQLTNK